MNFPTHTSKSPRSRSAALFFAALTAAAILLAPGCAATPKPSQVTAAPAPVSQPCRIGTYDSRAIAIAYARSESFAASMKSLHEQHAKAKAADNTDDLKSLEKQAELRQIRLHLQGFSNAPVDDALDHIRPALAEVAQKRGITTIVSTADYHDSSVQLVDITDDLVQLFHPTPQTLKIVKELKAQQPLPIEQVAQIPANE